MYASLVTWQICRPGPDFEELIDDIDRAAGLWPKVARRPGFVTGHVVQVAPDTMVSLTVYESAEQAESSFSALQPTIRELMGSQVRIVERRTGPAHEIGAPVRR